MHILEDLELVEQMQTSKLLKNYKDNKLLQIHLLLEEGYLEELDNSNAQNVNSLDKIKITHTVSLSVKSIRRHIFSSNATFAATLLLIIVVVQITIACTVMIVKVQQDTNAKVKMIAHLA